MKTKLSCETSLKIWKLKMWKRSAWTGSSTARPIRAWSAPSRTRSATLARQTFPIHLPRHVLPCKTQHSVHPLALKNVFNSRRPLNLPAKRSCETSLNNGKLKTWKRSFRARLPSKSGSWRCENEAFGRDFPQKLKVEDVKTKLSCETSFKNWKLKTWKRRCRARLPSKTEG